MKDYIIIKKIKFGTKHSPTGKCHNYLGNKEISDEIKELKIAEYKGGKAYYLFYYNAKGVELTDSYHESLENAFRQAEFEFNIKPEEWQTVK